MEKKVKLLPSAIKALADKDAATKQQADVVRVLERLLERAKAGHIDGMAAVVSYSPDLETDDRGEMGSVYVVPTHGNTREWLGMVEILKQRIFFGLCQIDELAELY